MIPFKCLIIDDKASDLNSTLYQSVWAIQSELQVKVEECLLQNGGPDPLLVSEIVGGGSSLKPSQCEIKTCDRDFQVNRLIELARQMTQGLWIAVFDPCLVRLDGTLDVATKCGQLARIVNAIQFDAILYDRDLTNGMDGENSQNGRFAFDGEMHFLSPLQQSFLNAQNGSDWINERVRGFTNDTSRYEGKPAFTKSDSNSIGEWMFRLWIQKAAVQNGLIKRGISRLLHCTLDTFESVIAFHGFPTKRRFDFDHEYTGELGQTIDVIESTISSLKRTDQELKSTLSNCGFDDDLKQFSQYVVDASERFQNIRDGANAKTLIDRWKSIGNSPKSSFRLNLSAYLRTINREDKRFEVNAQWNLVGGKVPQPDVYLPVNEFCDTFKTFLYSVLQKSGSSNSRLDVFQVFPLSYIANDQRVVLKTLLRVSWGGSPLYELAELEGPDSDPARLFGGADAINCVLDRKWRSFYECHFLCSSPSTEDFARISFAGSDTKRNSIPEIAFPGYCQIPVLVSEEHCNTAVFVFEAMQKPSWRQ